MSIFDFIRVLRFYGEFSSVEVRKLKHTEKRYFYEINLCDMKGINFVTDENNNKIAVLLSYDVYGDMLDDLILGLVAESRKDEERIPLEEVIKELEDKGNLDKYV